MSDNDVICGDCAEVLQHFADNTFDSCVTDPPYGLGSKDPTVKDIVTYLQGSGLDTGGDFMGKKWEIPSVNTWKEIYRVLKPGAHVLCFAGTRTWDIISIGARAAGFEFRDTIALDNPGLQWKYGQGFPKSLNVSTAIAETDVLEAKKWKGCGTALKPSWEPILVFRKPLKGTVAKNVCRHGTGAINIDSCRVASGADKGRWPSNTVLVHAEGCKRTGKCVNGCPVKALDEQSGKCGAQAPVLGTEPSRAVEPNTITGVRGRVPGAFHSDSGTASRFFPQFFYCAKATKKEATLGGKIYNNHPTKKPLKLMRWLVRLVTPKGGRVLDPYCGSGTTLQAAMNENMRFVGIEKDEDYHNIAMSRVFAARLIMGRH